MKHAPDALASFQDVTVRYPYQQKDAVGPASLEVMPGERLLLLGTSGSGKSTLLNTLTGLIPQTIPADVRGEAMLFGRPSPSRAPAEWAPLVARLFQNAEETLCGMTIADEVAFALENQAVPEAEIVRRASAALAMVGLEAEATRRTMSLSGGEKQIVALAAVLAQEAQLLVVDEPTAHLAPAAARRLRDLLLASGGGRTVLIVDHRLDGLIDRVDRIALIGPDGTLAAIDEPRGFFRQHGEMLAAIGAWRPLAAEFDGELRRAGIELEVPLLSMAEAVAALETLPERGKRVAVEVARHFIAGRQAPPSEPGAAIAELKEAICAPLFGPVVLRDVSLAVHRGEAVAILGSNGAGKSTLGGSLAGLLRLKGGARTGAAGGVAFQNPENQFLAGSVREEIGQALSRDIPQDERGEIIDETLAEWNLADLASRHPYELSQGQKRRLALATLTVSDRWPLLVLDEPTAGLDAAGVAMLANRIDALRSTGHALAIITHDMDFALRCCSRAVIVGEGGILADARAVDVMSDKALLSRAGLEPPLLLPLMQWLGGGAPSC